MTVEGLCKCPIGFDYHAMNCPVNPGVKRVRMYCNEEVSPSGERMEEQ